MGYTVLAQVGFGLYRVGSGWVWFGLYKAGAGWFVRKKVVQFGLFANSRIFFIRLIFWIKHNFFKRKFENKQFRRTSRYMEARLGLCYATLKRKPNVYSQQFLLVGITAR